MDKPEITIRTFDTKGVNDFMSDLDNIREKFSESQPILVIVDSFGGSIYGLASIYEALQAVNNPIVTYCTSKAMSAGAIILSTCGTPGLRFASPNATVMVHELSSGNGGNIIDQEGYHEYLKIENDKWMTILAKSMGLKKGKEIREILLERGKGHDYYMNAEEALEMGIIDQVGYLKLQPQFSWNIIALEEGRKEREIAKLKREQAAIKRAEKRASKE